MTTERPRVLRLVQPSSPESETGFRDYLLCEGLADGTIRNYVQIVARAEKWCEAHGHQLATLSPSGARALGEEWPGGQSTKKLLQAAVGHYWKHLRRADAPTHAIRVPKRIYGVCRALEVDEMSVLAKAARAHGGPAGLAVALGLYAGLRREEIAKLRWTNIGAEYVTITGKGNRVRSIPVHPVLVELLSTKARQGDYVFPGRFGGPASPATIWQWCRTLAEESGLGPVTTHRLRHSCLASINDNTRDLRTTQEIAGHARPETTMIYTRTTGTRLRTAINGLDY
ncbi:MAG TPA: tyrosine-type recombinase/integrase [Acidimicrobiales bacterium]|nr:tyrosine-type recombinase/integrase [Acidimicrobiales bacterium]